MCVLEEVEHSVSFTPPFPPGSLTGAVLVIGSTSRH